jgi:hypothetical protein
MIISSDIPDKPHSHKKIQCQCDICGVMFTRQFKYITESRKRYDTSEDYCKRCCYDIRSPKREVVCETCKKPFTVGMICGDEVKIKIVSVDDDFITAEVIEVNEFWGSRPTGAVADRHAGIQGRGHVKKFEPGLVLRFRNCPSCSMKIEEPRWLPWFSLSSSGKFEHYR